MDSGLLGRIAVIRTVKATRAKAVLIEANNQAAAAKLEHQTRQQRRSEALQKGIAELAARRAQLLQGAFNPLAPEVIRAAAERIEREVSLLTRQMQEAKGIADEKEKQRASAAKVWMKADTRANRMTEATKEAKLDEGRRAELRAAQSIEFKPKGSKISGTEGSES